MTNGIALAAHFGDGVLRADDVAAGLHRRGRARIRWPTGVVWHEYLETVVRERKRLARPVPRAAA